jgi:hypothetical protein
MKPETKFAVSDLLDILIELKPKEPLKFCAE